MQNGDDFFDAHFIIDETARPQPRSTLTVSCIPSDVQGGDVAFYSPSGERRGKRREWPWVLATLSLIAVSAALMFAWMVTHPTVRDVGLLGLSLVAVFIAGMVGGFLCGLTWSRPRGL